MTTIISSGVKTNKTTVNQCAFSMWKASYPASYSIRCFFRFAFLESNCSFRRSLLKEWRLKFLKKLLPSVVGEWNRKIWHHWSRLTVKLPTVNRVSNKLTLWRLCDRYNPPSLWSLVTVIIWSLWTRLIDHISVFPFPANATRSKPFHFVLQLPFPLKWSVQEKKSIILGLCRFFGPLIEKYDCVWDIQTVLPSWNVSETRVHFSRCLPKWLEYIFPSFFLMIAVQFARKYFFPCNYFGPSGTSMSVFVPFVCISVYCRTQRVFIHFCDGSTPLKKKIDKNRWSSGQKNSKMPKISMNNCVGSYRIWLLYFHLFSVRAFSYDGRMPKDT